MPKSAREWRESSRIQWETFDLPCRTMTPSDASEIDDFHSRELAKLAGDCMRPAKPEPSRRPPPNYRESKDDRTPVLPFRSRAPIGELIGQGIHSDQFAKCGHLHGTGKP